MKHRTILVASAAALAVAGIITGLVIWLNQPSYNDTLDACAKALDTQYKAGGHGKPGACHGVKDDDYTTLVANAAMGHLGWLDDDGNLDENKMLDSVTETP
ncbi:hypothetical protein [Streptomyces sp. L2]|uniref:hypothetical protein n=1 Tax=Streptomyces sp. L2 TaxID=2162665 RepID=UPI001012430A|nr:hypothetical protein [Streptomyces sp. L2]